MLSKYHNLERYKRNNVPCVLKPREMSISFKNSDDENKKVRVRLVLVHYSKVKLINFNIAKI